MLTTPQESQAQQSNVKKGREALSTTHEILSKEELAVLRSKVGTYRSLANSMLAIATFAGTITLTVILAPGNGTDVPGLTVLAYSSSIFIGSIMGCIFMIVSIELNVPLNVMRVEAVVVGLTLFSAFFLLLLASSLFLNYRGPFILGSILYLGFSVLIGLFSWLSWRKVRFMGIVFCEKVAESRGLVCNCR